MKIRCKICGSTNTANILNNQHTNLIKCFKCDVIFVHPQPREILKKNINFYQNDRKNYLGAERELFKRAEKLLKEIKRYKNGGKLLEIGSSYGFFLKMARDEGFDTYGIEISSDAVNYSRRRFGLKIFRGTIRANQFSPSNFDIIIMSDVLEHMTDPQKELGRLIEILKPQGLLFVQVPNFNSIMAKITGEGWNWLLPSVHLFHFSPNSIKIIIKSQNFKIIDIKTYDRPIEIVNNILNISFNNKTDTLTSKASHKLIKMCLYVIFYFLSPLWCRFNKGGLIQVYATR